MTKAQEKAIANLKRSVEKDLLINENYEIKEWKVEDNGFYVALTFETGLKNDEGTMAQYYGRDRGIVIVGERGGLKCWNSKKLTNETVKNLNVWQIVCAYKG